MSCSDIFLGLIAVLFPPIAVWIKSGICSADSLINILLCVLGWLPGLIHAWYIIAKYPEHDHDYQPIDAEAGRRRQRQQQRGGQVTYYVINSEQTPQGPRTYGTQGQSKGAKAPGGAPASGNSTAATSGVAGSSSQAAGGSSQEEGSSAGGAPPSYSEVVRGDNKIQSHD